MVTPTVGPEATRPATVPRLEGIEIAEWLRRGVVGTLWRGRDIARDIPLLIKTFHVDSADYGRLLAVGERLSRLDHPGLARLLARRGEGDGLAWVMEAVEGVPLETLLAENGARLSERSLRRLLVALLDALETLHGAGLTHRDIKPGNIVVRSDGSPVLADFDAAALLDGERPADADSLQTPGYAAPEQSVAGGEEGPWTDLYGLAAVAYRAIAGEPPPDARDRLADDRMAPARTAGGDHYSQSFLAGIDGALALDPAARPPSARAWRAALITDETADRGPQEPEEDAAPAVPPAIAPEDDGPPTVRVRRRLTPPVAKPGIPGAPVATPTADAPVGSRAGRRRAWLPVALVVAAVLAVAGWQAYGYYLSEIKSTWVVDAAGGGDTRSIADALSRAKAGAVITVRPGTYAETLAMVRPHRLQGGGDPEDVIVLGAGSAPCLSIAAEGAAVQGLTLQGGVSGGGAPASCLAITGGDVAVENVVVSSVTGPAVRISGDAAPRLTGVRASAAAAPGLLIEDSARPVVGDSTLTGGAAPAVVVAGDARPDIAASRISGGEQAGVVIAGGAPGLRDNDITEVARSGIEVRGGASPTLAGNRIRGAGEAGIYVHGAGGVIEGNVVEGSGISGVVLGDGATPEVVENRIEGSAEHGVLAMAGAGGRVVNNTVVGNTGLGIARDVGAETAFEDNALSGNRTPQRRTGDVIFGDEPEYAEDVDAAEDTPVAPEEGPAAAMAGGGAPDDVVEGEGSAP